jgi:uncharacterized protein YdaU (DUF1376 family)
MHYYKRNIGDYAKKAGRLTMLQHGAYTLLLDACYDRERFPTREEAIAWCWAFSAEEIAAVEFVIYRFFDLVDGQYVQARIQDEITAFRKNAKTNQRIAIEREETRRSNRERIEHEPCTNEHEPTPNQEPLTINHKTVNPLVSRADDVPIDRIVEAYNTVLGGTLPRAQRMTEARRKHIKARWREMLGTTDANGKLRYADQDAGVEWFGRFFRKVLTNPHWTGDNDRGWTASLDWVMNPTNFTKILEYVPHDARKS